MNMTPAISCALVVRRLVAEACAVNPQEIGTHDRLVEDLRIDSLEMAALLLAIDQALGVSLDATSVHRVSTVAQLEAAVAACIAVEQ